MKISLFITAFMAVLCAANVSAKEQREHLKCYLQIEDKSQIVKQFVVTDTATKTFISQLIGHSVYLADGVTKKKIIQVYECTDLETKFSGADAAELEKNTPM